MSTANRKAPSWLDLKRIQGNATVDIDDTIQQIGALWPTLAKLAYLANLSNSLGHDQESELARELEEYMGDEMDVANRDGIDHMLGELVGTNRLLSAVGMIEDLFTDSEICRERNNDEWLEEALKMGAEFFGPDAGELPPVV